MPYSAAEDQDAVAPVAARAPERARGEAALASLHFPWRRLGYRVVFAAGQPGRLGRTNGRRHTITVFVRPGQSELSLRATIAHELGHALDFRYGTPDRHRRYSQLRRLGTGAWYPASGQDDLNTPAGDFAEVFAYALVGPGDFRSRLSGPPTSRELRLLGDLLSIPRAAPRVAPSGPRGATEPSPQPLVPPLIPGT